MKNKLIDIWALLSIVGLVAFGLFNMYGIRPDLIGNYVVFIVIGSLAFFVAYRTNMSLLKANSRGIYIAFVLLLGITLFFSSDIRGSRRWINLGLFQFQTAEFFKPFFLIIVAHLLSKENRFSFYRLLFLFIVAAIPFVAILLQPDLGMVIQFLAVLVILVYFAGTSSRLMIRIMLAGVAMIPFAWFFLLKEYQKARVIGFMNPDVDPQGLTYNLNQSIITIGSGGWFGQGLGLGTQARYRFLPEFQTDFAFASMIEQFGFLGGMAVLMLFSFLLYRLIKRLFQQQENMFQHLYIIGTISFISLSIVVNIGMNLGLLPVTGIALPFISYGGSSIVSTLMLLGFALAI